MPMTNDEKLPELRKKAKKIVDAIIAELDARKIKYKFPEGPADKSLFRKMVLHDIGGAGIPLYVDANTYGTYTRTYDGKINIIVGDYGTGKTFRDRKAGHDPARVVDWIVARCGALREARQAERKRTQRMHDLRDQMDRINAEIGDGAPNAHLYEWGSTALEIRITNLTEAQALAIMQTAKKVYE